MTRSRLLICLLLIALAWSWTATAQPGGYELPWFTVDGGGGVSTSTAGYAVVGTIGQPEASQVLQGGNYTLAGGFWGWAAVSVPPPGPIPTPSPLPPPAELPHHIYLPAVAR